jgi:hypothetical protein
MGEGVMAWQGTYSAFLAMEEEGGAPRLSLGGEPDGASNRIKQKLCLTHTGASNVDTIWCQLPCWGCRDDFEFPMEVFWEIDFEVSIVVIW